MCDPFAFCDDFSEERYSDIINSTVYDDEDDMDDDDLDEDFPFQYYEQEDCPW